jgi:uncharacterized protein YcnI
MKESPRMHKALTAGAVALVLLLLPTAADAHVTVQPATAPSGGFTRLDLVVPNERSDAGTVKVDVQLPPGVISASYAPVPGWAVKLKREKLATPVKTEDGFEVDEQISQITWTGNGARGVIPPGAFQEFGLQVKLPTGRPGETLTFKALQTYAGGEVVRWIGPPDSDEPAPTITLTPAASSGGHGVASMTGDQSAANATTTAATDSSDDGGGSDTLSIVALVVGALGLMAGVAGLLAARRAGAARDREGIAG